MAQAAAKRGRSKVFTKDGPPRNIAIFIDGTWNRAGTRTPTNVRKLFEATLEGDHNGREQGRLYIQGVGAKPTVDAGLLSDADYNAELRRYLLRDSSPVMTPTSQLLVGGATGMGTSARIRATYHYLCKHFRRQSGDKVFLFGFSRGAFAARSLAGFVGHVGLLLADKLKHVERAYELYERSEDPAQSELGDFLYRLTGKRVVSNDDEQYVKVGLTVDGAATWWTEWNDRPTVHHEIRNAFLATWPTPRSWLTQPMVEVWKENWKSHYFHRSTVDYLEESDPTAYKFRLPHVNSALRWVDDMALPLASCLSLRGQEVI